MLLTTVFSPIFAISLVTVIFCSFCKNDTAVYTFANCNHIPTMIHQEERVSSQTYLLDDTFD